MGAAPTVSACVLRQIILVSMTFFVVFFLAVLLLDYTYSAALFHCFHLLKKKKDLHAALSVDINLMNMEHANTKKVR